MLAHKFFNSKKVRMLLLSATPYKMYTTLEEMDEASDPDEYYKEFLDVMKFLNVTDEADLKFRKVWSDYSVELQEFSRGETSVIEAKNAAENQTMPTGRMYLHTVSRGTCRPFLMNIFTFALAEWMMTRP